MRYLSSIFCLLLSTFPVMAIEVSQRGATAMLNGSIKQGDDLVFRDFMARPEAKQIRILYLNSSGGRVFAAAEIARMVRKAGLKTVVDAGKSYCESACTGIFTGGVARHYINAGGVADGIGGKRVGLGFHEGNSAASGTRSYSGGATAAMIDTYYEMGVPGAAKVVTNASFNKIHRVSAQTALSLGIATSLGAP